MQPVLPDDLPSDNPTFDLLSNEANRREFLHVLEWLWTGIAEPVLTALGHTEVAYADPPRMWWCPTGPLTALPLHAAGRHPDERRATDLAQTAAGRVVSSYTPTLTALTGMDPGRGLGDCLVVAVASAPGWPPLPAVGVELTLLRARMPMAPCLIDENETAAWVRAAIAARSWVHLACHAGHDQDDPVNGAFAMWDKQLTIAELIGARTCGGALAYPRWVPDCVRQTAGRMRHLSPSGHLSAPGLELLPAPVLWFRAPRPMSARRSRSRGRLRRGSIQRRGRSSKRVH